MKQKATFKCMLTVTFLVVTAMLTGCKTTQNAQPSTLNPQPSTLNAQRSTPIGMILDADFGSSTDDLFALMMLNHYIDEGKVDLKGIIVDREGEDNAGVVDIFNTYYGHPEIPVGLERNGVKNPRCFIPYNGICKLKNEQGQPLFKRSFDASQCPDGYKLYRQLLSKADDKSLVVVAIGFATTLSQLFESGADEFSPLSGVELFGQKVKAVYIQSGRFEAGDSLCGYNMRAAARQSAVFYEKLPHSVELIMSPSNIGDQMNYLPKDVMADLSYSDLNPIKAVYSNYHCDTGQRMWDTNCLVNAVEGDGAYHLSPRGWVTFVERGQQSLMLFKPDPAGNARYQIPGDSYYNEVKLMDIRRYNRMNSHPAAFTIEAPQPQLTGTSALSWAKPRLSLLMDKFFGTAGNHLDPDDVRMLFRPIGYNGTNPADYAQAEQLLEDTLYSVMLSRAVNSGNKDLVIVTGAPACGKTTALRQLKLKNAGVIYDAALTGPGRLEQVVGKAYKAGIEKVTVVMVYNDVLTCYKNAVNRGANTWNYVPLDYMVSAYRDNVGKLAAIGSAYPNIEIVPIDMTGNKPMERVSIDEALAWSHDVTDEELNALFTYLLTEIESGEISSAYVPAAAGNVLAIPRLDGANLSLAREINQKVEAIREANRMNRQ